MVRRKQERDPISSLYSAPLPPLCLGRCKIHLSQPYSLGVFGALTNRREEIRVCLFVKQALESLGKYASLAQNGAAGLLVSHSAGGALAQCLHFAPRVCGSAFECPQSEHCTGEVRCCCK